MALTGLKDTDLLILNQLNLKDLTVCQTNRYFNQLYHDHIDQKLTEVRKRVVHILNFLNENQSCVFQTYKYIDISQFVDIMKIIHIDQHILNQIKNNIEYMENDGYDRPFDVYAFDIAIAYDGKIYGHIQFNPNANNGIYFIMTPDQLNHFLMHLIYNNMLFTF